MPYSIPSKQTQTGGLGPFNCPRILIWRLVILTLSLPKGNNLTLARETLRSAQGDN